MDVLTPVLVVANRNQPQMDLSCPQGTNQAPSQLVWVLWLTDLLNKLSQISPTSNTKDVSRS